MASLFEAPEAVAAAVSVGSISLSAMLLDDAADEDALLEIRFLLLLEQRDLFTCIRMLFKEKGLT